MLYRACFRYRFATIRDSLKTLQISSPTTKQTIKKQYLTLAKKYHPDSTQCQEKQKEKFVQINKAYEYLKQLSDEEINSNKDKKMDNISQEQEESIKTKEKMKMTKQERERKQTYEYFNRRQKRSGREEVSSDDYQYKNKPLYKTVPELFVGFLFVGLIFGQWVYMSLKKQNQNFQQKNINNHKHRESGHYEDVFKSMSLKKRFEQKPRQRERQTQ